MDEDQKHDRRQRRIDHDCQDELAYDGEPILSPIFYDVESVKIEE